MSIKSIRIKNLLSFDDFIIKDFADINCIIGRNNVGKSNLLKIITFFYNCLSGEIKELPQLNSSYSSYGEITLCFNTVRLEDVVRSTKGKSPYQKHIYKTLFKSEINQWEYLLNKSRNKETFTLSLRINKNNSISWSDNDKNIRDIIYRIYPFLYIDTRRINLYDWSDVWEMVSKLKFLNTNNLSRDNLVDFIDNKVSNKSNSYKEYVNTIRNIAKTAPYDYRDLILNYIKVGLEGHSFNINGFDLTTQSDGTNSYQFLEIFLHLVIMLTRREFITPTIFVDEPEIGLHPKKGEELIENLHHRYRSLKNDEAFRVSGKYRNPFPVILLSTHSPNILKTVVRLFNHKNEHRVFHFILDVKKVTSCSLMRSQFDDNRFLSVFNDNEARLFFSNFILFVEGETELELFGNLILKSLFPVMNKIDVYKTNEVMLKAIVPSRSNVSIPYLVLYDADKMIDINLNNGAITFTQKEVNLPEMLGQYKYGYWGSKNYDSKVRLSNILAIGGAPNFLNHHKTGFEKIDIEDMIFRINRLLLEKRRVKVSFTTTEGCLININSRNIFLRWLLEEFDKNVVVGTKGDPNKIIDKWRTTIGKVDVVRAFKAIYTGHTTSIEISPVNQDYAIEIKRLLLKHVAKEFYKCKISRELSINILRLAFEGKTDTLCSKDNKNYSFISNTIKDLVTILDDYVLRNIPTAGKKTSGWVTNFINYAVSYWRTKSQNDNEVRLKFRRAFQEISAIIDDVSSSID